MQGQIIVAEMSGGLNIFYNETIGKRLARLREQIKLKEIDGVFITKRENYMYLSGFTGTYAYLIVTMEEAILLTDFRYTEQASKQAPLFNIVQYQGSLLIALNEIIQSRNILKLGFEDIHMTFDRYSEYSIKLNLKDFLPLGGMIESLRIIKDTQEIEIINKAVEISDKAFEHILGYIKPNVTELDISTELEYFMKKLGAKGESFEIIVASGERSSMPHGVASSKKIQSGDVITMDYGCIYDNYCSDMTRTVFLGEPDKEMKKIYNIVLKAQFEALQSCKAGLTGKEIDYVARDIIDKSGFGKNFGHGLGHGVGIEVHEEPRLSLSGNTKMEDGMVVTVEPGIYVPGLGGVRIEDMLVISADVPTVLTKSTKEMIVI
jgi:Xaa-Pro aminopeptidase